MSAATMERMSRSHGGNRMLPQKAANTPPTIRPASGSVTYAANTPKTWTSVAKT